MKIMPPNIFLTAINSLSIDNSFRKNKSYITTIIFTLILLQFTITFLPVNATHTGVEMADPIIFDEDLQLLLFAQILSLWSRLWINRN